MKTETLHTFLFSPTGTSRTIAEAAARGFGAIQHTTHDATRHEVAPLVIPPDEVALFAVPVYGGKVAPTALKRLEFVRGEQTPALLAVVYGNRAFEGALQELAEFVSTRGFIPVAGAAFVGEHSYSTAEHPIAASRPDTHDLAEAKEWGRNTVLLLEKQGVVELDTLRIKQPASGFWSLLRFIRFVVGYRRRQKRNPVIPHVVTSDACTGCGLCAKCCPTQAIAPGDERHTDAARCIRCCACVKVCPVQARTFTTPFAPVLSRCFRRPKPNVFLPHP